MKNTKEEYSIFIQRVREYNKISKDLKEALRRTGMSEKEFKEATKYLVKWNKNS